MVNPRIVRTTGIAATIVLAVALGFRLTWAGKEAAEPGAPDVLDPNAYVSATVPDDENAALWLRAGSQALVLTKDQRDFVGELTTTPLVDWTPAQHEQVRMLIERARPALDLIRMQRFLYVAALDALDRGDRDALLSIAAPMPLVAVSLERESPIIAALVGVACDKMYVDVVRQAIARPQTDLPTLDQLERLMPENDLRQVWRRTIASEFALGEVRMDQASVPTARPAPRGDDGQRRAEIAAFADSFDHPFGASKDWVGEQQRRIAQAGVATITVEERVKAAGRFQCSASARRLAHVACALRREAMRTGTYPNTLAAISGASDVDPFYGLPAALTVRPDGSAVLAVPNGEAIYKAFWQNVHPPDLHTWQLPAPERQR